MTSRRTRFIGFVVFVALVCSISLHAQPRKQIDAQRIKINKQTQIPYIRFELKNPRTGEVLTPDKILTLRNSKRIRADEYVEKLNRIERWLNENGYSLRTLPSNQRVEEIVEISETHINDQLFRNQEQRIRNEHRPISSKKLKPPSFNENSKLIEQQRLAQLRNMDMRLISILHPINTSRSWNSGLIGDEDVFGVALETTLGGTGDGNGATLAATGVAKGVAFNEWVDLIRITENLNAPRSGKKSAKLEATILGMGNVNIFSDEKDGDEAISPNTTTPTEYSVRIDVPVVETTIPVGPVPVSLRVRVVGSAGTAYELTVRSALAKGTIKPYVNVQVRAEAGVDAVVARAGVGGSVNLFDDTLTLAGEMSINASPESGQFYFLENLQADNRIRALNGNLYVFACIDYWLDEKCWRHKIFKWKGIDQTGNLFTYRRETPFR